MLVNGAISRSSVLVTKSHQWIFKIMVGSGGRAVERPTVNRGDGGSISPTAVSKLRQFV